MSGAILGIFGKQRSGKTLLSYLIASSICKQSQKSNESIRCYSNLYCTDLDFKYIDSISDIPLDLEPKIVLVDEIYNGCDAQDYKKLKDISIYINTIGKQNCLFIFTSIDASMVYNRIRNQLDMCVLVKGYPERIDYKIINFNNYSEKLFTIEKNKELFQNLKYDTNFIPKEFDWKMDKWNRKLDEYYKRYYNM